MEKYTPKITVSVATHDSCQQININDTEKTLLALISRCLFGVQNIPDDEINWKSLLKESITQSVPIIAFEGIGNKSAMPEEANKRFRGEAENDLLSNFLIHSYHGELNRIMTENGIPYCVLKGCSTAFYYELPEYRAMGDVDFYVNPCDFDRASAALTHNGFKQWEKNVKHHIVFTKDDMHFELHHEPSGIPVGESGKKIKEYFKDVITSSQTKKIHNITFSKPSDFHHGLIVLLHTIHHLTTEGIGLRHLCDWAVFANSFSNEDFAVLFKEKLTAVGLWKFAQVLSCTASKYIGMPYKEWMGKIDETMCGQLISDIVSGGNFGRKDKSRYTESLFISTRGENGFSVNMVKQFFLSVNHIIYSHWASAKRKKVLLVPGYIFFGTRYFIRFIFGKRKALVSSSIIKCADRRKELYRDFHLFEAE